MKIYSISKGQLITIWFFGAFGWLVMAEEGSSSGFVKFLGILIPFFLIFYTLGWKKKRKEAKNNLTK